MSWLLPQSGCKRVEVIQYSTYKKRAQVIPRQDDHGSKAKDIGLIFISLSLRLKSIIKQAHESVMLASLYPGRETVSLSSQRKN